MAYIQVRMSSEQLHSTVPFEKGHTHFLDSIVAFPELETGPSFAQRQKYTKDMIKYQLMAGSPEMAKRYINLRECFKFTERRYVEFCLMHKVPGTSINQAAKELGYRK